MLAGQRDRHLFADQLEVGDVGMTVVELRRPDRRVPEIPLNLRVGQFPGTFGVGRPTVPEALESEPPDALPRAPPP